MIPDEQAETPLTGGRITTGVVRIGNTVRKPITSNSRFVRRLLVHLDSNDFGCSPVFLGTDEQERDIFSFIDGEVPKNLSFHDDSTLRTAASLIRKYHDLSSELITSSTEEGYGCEVVCHNDLSPCNFVFRDDAPVAIIDFDASAPGTRADDLGYAAWLWLDLGSTEVSVADQRQRLENFVQAYGQLDVDSVLQAMLRRQTLLAEEGRSTGNEALVKWALACNEWTRENLEVLRGV